MSFFSDLVSDNSNRLEAASYQLPVATADAWIWGEERPENPESPEKQEDPGILKKPALDEEPPLWEDSSVLGMDVLSPKNNAPISHGRRVSSPDESPSIKKTDNKPEGLKTLDSEKGVDNPKVPPDPVSNLRPSGEAEALAPAKGEAPLRKMMLKEEVKRRLDSKETGPTGRKVTEIESPFRVDEERGMMNPIRTGKRDIAMEKAPITKIPGNMIMKTEAVQGESPSSFPDAIAGEGAVMPVERRENNAPESMEEPFLPKPPMDSHEKIHEINEPAGANMEREDSPKAALPDEEPVRGEMLSYGQFRVKERPSTKETVAAPVLGNRVTIGRVNIIIKEDAAKKRGKKTSRHNPNTSGAIYLRGI